MDKIYFTINGDHYTLSGSEVSPGTTLNDFIRSNLQLFGTKAMCHEGGCGACVVSVAATHPVTKERDVFSVNSCLVHILSCHEWDITTVEGLGGRHPIQTRLAAFNGSQCGYCSPGWVMAMYSLYESSHHKLSVGTVESSFGGHMCRCTGYRPILDALKSFATDCGAALAQAAKLHDVEDLDKACPPQCSRRASVGAEWCVLDPPSTPREITLSGDKSRWYKAYTISDIFKILAKEGTDNYSLIAGNTGKGVFWSPAARVQIDISAIEELRECQRAANLRIGAGVTLTEMMEQCNKWQGSTGSEFDYLAVVRRHLDLVAHVSVRNLGSIGGNLAMKRQHPEFPSDVFILLEAVRATITIVDKNEKKLEVSPTEFLQQELTGKVIHSVQLPPMGPQCHLCTYKVCVFWSPAARVQIDISAIEELRECQRAANLRIGAGVTLTEMMEQCNKWQGSTGSEFDYLAVVRRHLDLVAHVSVRNLGSIGGNLAMKRQHPEFPSDVFILLEAVRATITIVDKNEKKLEVSPTEFLQQELTGKVIHSVQLPPMGPQCHLCTYKIMPRAQNAHAIVNAAFLFQLDPHDKVTSATIVYGNIASGGGRATNTEAVIRGNSLYSDVTLQHALAKLKEDIVPSVIPPDPSPKCRKDLALGLFYKAILSLCPNVSARYKSGGSILQRGVSKGSQTFDTDKSLWPLNQPVPKAEAPAQCAGSARYSCDVEAGPRQLHAALVLSTRCGVDIRNIDTSQALKQPGVVAVLTAKDIPGRNSFTPTKVMWMEQDEEILATKTVLYNGQPVAIVAATTKQAALNATHSVKVTYEDKPYVPVLSIRDALLAKDRDRRVRKDVTVERKTKGTDIQHVVKGSLNMGGQYHYTLEPQGCHATPTATGLALRAATQWMDLVQIAVGDMLNVPHHRIHVEVERVGGAYGGKASRSALAACIAALVAHILNRPARVELPIWHNMTALGMRGDFDADYEVGVNSSGVIQYLDASYYTDCGCSFNDSPADGIADVMAALYAADTFHIEGYSVLTDKAANTWCRAPGTTEAIALMEHIMERISHVTSLDPLAVRVANLATEHEDMNDIVTGFKKDVDYDQRIEDIEKYNKENAWKKKGLKVTLMCYPIDYPGYFPVTVSIYHGDGTVCISHGGIEMGQGINTKVAQVCAYSLKIPLHKVLVIGSDSFTSPNALASNGSISSDSVAFATVVACEQINKRLDEARAELNRPATWEELIKKAFEMGINLQASHLNTTRDGLKGYTVYGVCGTEVEMDVLTGQHVVRRVDLLEDTGVSMSPDIDVGQIEGAFMMGLGLWTSEQLVHEPSSGRLLTNSTWTYKPAGARDVPEDLRVVLRPRSANSAGVLRSKATGEPALTLAVCVTHALRHAVEAARAEFGYSSDDWLQIRNPCTVENILDAIAPKTEYYKLQ